MSGIKHAEGKTATVFLIIKTSGEGFSGTTMKTGYDTLIKITNQPVKITF